MWSVYRYVGTKSSAGHIASLLTVEVMQVFFKDRLGFQRDLLTYLLTYLLTPWSRILLEKLIGSAAIQEIPRLFGTRRFLTVPTSARHLSLS